MGWNPEPGWVLCVVLVGLEDVCGQVPYNQRWASSSKDLIETETQGLRAGVGPGDGQGNFLQLLAEELSPMLRKLCIQKSSLQP